MKLRKEKFRLIFISALIVFLFGVLISSTYSDWAKILENNSEALALQTEYDNLISQEDKLKSDVTKLSDPEYVARYAKEKYLFSSEGEIILKLD